jgi:hypothetical protein
MPTRSLILNLALPLHAPSTPSGAIPLRALAGCSVLDGALVPSLHWTPHLKFICRLIAGLSLVLYSTVQDCPEHDMPDSYLYRSGMDGSRLVRHLLLEVMGDAYSPYFRWSPIWETPGILLAPVVSHSLDSALWLSPGQPMFWRHARLRHEAFLRYSSLTRLTTASQPARLGHVKGRSALHSSPANSARTRVCIQLRAWEEASKAFGNI